MSRFVNSYNDGHEHDFVSHFANPRRCCFCGVGEVVHKKNVREKLELENARPILHIQPESCPMWPKEKEEFTGVCGAGSEIGGDIPCTVANGLICEAFYTFNKNRFDYLNSHTGNVGIGGKEELLHYETVKEAEEKKPLGVFTKDIQFTGNVEINDEGKAHFETWEEAEKKKIDEVTPIKEDVGDDETPIIFPNQIKSFGDNFILTRNTKLSFGDETVFGPKECTINDKWAYFIYENKTIAVNKDDCWWDDKHIVIPDIEYNWIETEESRELESAISKINNEYLKNIIEDSLSCYTFKKQIKVFKGLKFYKLELCEFYLGVPCGIGTESPKTKLEIIGRENAS